MVHADIAVFDKGSDPIIYVISIGIKGKAAEARMP